MNPDWTPPTGDDPKLGRLDQVRCGEDDGRTRIWSDWLPPLRGTRFPAPPIAGDDPSAEDEDVNMAFFLETVHRTTDHQWEPVAELRPRSGLPQGRSGYTQCWAISPCGRWGVFRDYANAFDELVLYRLPDGRRCGQVQGYGMLPPVFLPDSTAMLTCRRDRRTRLRLHNLTASPFEMTVRDVEFVIPRNAHVSAGAVSLWPRRLLAVWLSNEIRVYDLDTGERLARWQVGFSPDGNWLGFRPGTGTLFAGTTRDIGNLWMLDAPDGGPRRIGTRHAGGVIVGDGSWLVAAQGEALVIHDTSTGETIGEFSDGSDLFRGRFVRVLGSADHGRLIATLHVRRLGEGVRPRHDTAYWRIDPDRPLDLHCVGTLEDRIPEAGFPDRDAWVVPGSYHDTCATVMTSAGEYLSPAGNRLRPVVDAAFSADSSALVTSNGLLVSAETGGVMHDFGLAGTRLAVSTKADAPFALLTGDIESHRVVKLQLEEPWAVHRGNAPSDLERSPNNRVPAPAISADGRLVLANSWLMTADDLSPIRRLECNWQVNRGVALSPRGRYAAVAWEANVSVYDCETGASIWTKGTARDEVASLAFAPDGDVLAVACDSGKVRWYHAADGRMIRKPPMSAEELFADRILPLMADRLPGRALMSWRHVSMWSRRTGIARVSPDRQKLVVIGADRAMLFHRARS